MSWHSSPFPSFHPPIQFNTSLFSYGFVPVLGPGDTETEEVALPSRTHSVVGRQTTGLNFCQVPSLGRVCTWIPVLRCEGSQRERLSLAPAKRQRAHLCVCPGGDKVICLGPLWPSLPHPCHHSHLLVPHFKSDTQAFPFSNTPVPYFPSTRKKSLWGANYNE